MEGDLRERIERFLYLEADLMDESRFDEWDGLWADEALYWVPCNDDDGDPDRQVTIIYDDRNGIRDRLARLNSTAAHSQRPRSRMRRLISNVVFDIGPDGVVEVRSNFLLAELRHGRQDLFAGRSVHRLQERGDGFEIIYKKVLLLNNDEPIDNLTFLI